MVDRAQARAVARILGHPLPEDPEAARTELRRAIRARNESRRHAEGAVRSRQVVEAAIRAATMDRQLSTSPELERIRSWGERLVLRRDTARFSADRVVYLLDFVLDSLRKEEAKRAEAAGDEAKETDDEDLPPAAPRMRAMLVELDALRSQTDQVGQ